MFKIPKRLSDVYTDVSKSNLSLTPQDATDPVYEAYMGIIAMENASMDLIHDHVYSTYTGIREDSPEIVREGLGDFLAGAVNFFKELIKKLGEFLKSMNLYMYSLFTNFEKFITKYKDKLLTGKKNYTVVGYEYDFTNNVPKTDVMSGIVADFNKEISDVSKLSKGDIIQRRDDYLSDTNMDRIRGSIIGVSTPLESTEFRQKVFEMFRSGEDSEKELHIDNTELKRYIDGYKDLRRKLDIARKDKMNLEKVYHEIQRFFERGARHQYVGNTKKVRTSSLDLDMLKRTSTEGDVYDSDDSRRNLELVNTYYQFRWRQSQEIATYSYQTYIERLNALKEATKLYEKIIRAAIFAPNEKGEAN